jgi:hypothetical protein
MVQEDWRLFLRDAGVVQVKPRKKNKIAVGSKTEGAAKRKKKNTSPGVMHLLGVGEQRLLRGLAAAGGTYAKRSKKSAAKKDGAVRDVLENLARAQETAVGQVAKVPRDLTRNRDLKRGSKRLRKSLRRVAY